MIVGDVSIHDLVAFVPLAFVGTVAGAFCLFIGTVFLGQRLGWKRPIVVSFSVTTAALVGLSIVMTVPDAAGSYPAQTNASPVSAAIASFVGAAVFVGGIAIVFDALAARSSVVRVAGSAIAALLAAMLGAFAAMFAGCSLGLGCL